MTKFKVHASQVCTMDCHFIWEVEADGKEEAEAKFAKLKEDDELPYKQLVWAEVGTKAAGVKCIDRWEDELDHDGGLEVLEIGLELEETT